MNEHEPTVLELAGIKAAPCGRPATGADITKTHGLTGKPVSGRDVACPVRRETGNE